MIFQIITSPHELLIQKVNATTTRKTFRRKNTVFGDAGYYGCADLCSTQTIRYNDNLETDQNYSFGGKKANISHILYVFIWSKNFLFKKEKLKTSVLFKNLIFTS